MTALASLFQRLRGDGTGAMAIETAILAPVLLVMSLGGVEAGSMVARQSELQSAAAEALNIVQAAPPKNPAQRTVVRDILKVSTGLTNDDVEVEEIFRCGTNAGFVEAKAECGAGAAVSTYIRITLRDTYTPTWTVFGLEELDGFDYNVVRTVQIS